MQNHGRRQFHILRGTRRNLFLALCLVAGLHQAQAQQTIDYTDGETGTSTIIITGPLNPTTLSTVTGSATQSGAISESGTAGSIIKTGTGTLTLTGSTSYTGATIISEGSLIIYYLSSIASSSGVTLSGTAIFDIHSGRQTIQDLTGVSGTVNLGGSTLTLGTTNSTTFGGLITGAVAAGITKIGTGTLTLTGTNNYTGDTTVDFGTLVVDSTGVINASTGNVNVGYNSGDNATMTISNGGSVSTGNYYSTIGMVSGSTGSVTVTGANSSWTNNGTLTVGYLGTGTLTISNGGSVSDTIGSIGYFKNSLLIGTGNVTVTGTNSLWTNTSELDLGYSGTGTLTISNGGTVKVGATGTGNLSVAQGGSSVGTLNIGDYDLTQATTAGTVQAASVAFGSGTGVVNFNQTDTTTFTVAISGGGTVVQRGTGTTILTGNNTYTGSTTISGGTLAIGSGGNISSSSGVNLTAAGATFDTSNAGDQTIQDLSGTFGSTVNMGGNGLTVGTSNSTEFDGSIMSNGGFAAVFNKTGSGTLTLTGTSSLGIMVVSSGTLAISHGGQVSSSIAEIGVGGTGSVTVDGTGSKLTANSGLVVGENNGKGTLTVSNSGTVSTGLLQIAFHTATGGTVNLDSGGVLSVEGVTYGGGTGGAAFNFNGGILRATGTNTDFISSFTGTEVTLQSGGGTIDNNSFDIGISSPLTGTGSATFTGSGATTLTGTNTYSGGTEIAGGVLQGNTDTAFGSGAVTVNAGTTLSLFGDVTVGNNITISGTGTTGQGAIFSSGTGIENEAITGTVTLAADATVGNDDNTSSGLTLGPINLSNHTLTVGTGSGFFNLNGNITGTGGIDFDSSDGVNISGGNNTFTGTSDVLSGTELDLNDGSGTAISGNLIIENGAFVSANVGGQFSPHTVVTLNGTGNLIIETEFGPISETIAGLQGTSSSASVGSDNPNPSDHPAGLTLDGTGSYAYAGVIRNFATAPLSLTMAGTGVQILSGTNTYRGGTTMNGGVLEVSTQGNLGTGGLTFGGGELLTTSTATFTEGIILNDGTNTLATTTGSTTTFTGSISGLTGSLTIGDGTNEGTIALTGSSTYGGGTTINRGTLAIGLGGDISSSSGVNLATSGGTFDISNGGDQTIQDLSGTFGSTVNVGGNALTVGTANSTEFDGSITGSTGGIVKTGSGTLTLTGTSNYGGMAIDLGTLAITHGGQVSTAIGGADVVGNVGTGSVTVDGTGSKWTVGNGIMLGVTGGKGILTISDGGTVSAVNVQLADAGASGGTVNLDSGGVLLTAQVLNEEGTGGAALNINGGILRASRASIDFIENFTGTEVTFQSGGATIDNNGFDIGISSPLTGTGSATFTGSGVTTLTGTNTYSGGTMLVSGTLILGNSSALGTGAITMIDPTMGYMNGDNIANAIIMEANTTLTVSGTDIATQTGTISESGTIAAITKIGTGTLILAGANTYSGGTEIASGILQGNTDTAFGSGAVTVDSGATLSLHNGLTLANGITISGTGTTGQGALYSVVPDFTNQTITSRVTLAADALIGDAGFASGLQLSGSINLSSHTLTVGTGSGLFFLSGDISGSGGLQINTPDAIIEGGNNTFTGVTDVLSGSLLELGDSDGTAISGNLTIEDGALVKDEFPSQLAANTVLTLNGSGTFMFSIIGSPLSESIAGLSGTSTSSQVTAGNGSSLDQPFSSVLTLSETGTYSYAGQINDAPGFGDTLSLVKSGSGTQILSGTSTYTGGTEVSGGILEADSSTALGTGGVTVDSGATLGLSGTTTLGNAITISGTGSASQGTLFSSGNGTFHTQTVTGTVTLAADSTVGNGGNESTLALGPIDLQTNTLTVGTGTGTFVLNGTITGTGGLAINTTDQVAIEGGNNTFTGTTHVLAGSQLLLLDTAGTAISGNLLIEDGATVSDIVGNQLSANTTITLDGSGTFEFGPSGISRSETVAGLTGTSSSSVVTAVPFASSSTNTLTLSETGTNSYAYAGQITDSGEAPGGTLNLIKTGTGTQTFSGVSTYHGATTINQGTLIINGSTLSTGLVSVASGATLGGTGSTGIVTVSGGGNIDLQDGKIGTLTVGGLTSGGGTASAFSFDIQTTGSTTTIDQITDTGTLTLNGAGGTTININALAGTTSLVGGEYDLLTYTGTQVSLANLSLSTTSLGGLDLALGQTGDTIYLVVASPTTYDLGASTSDPRVISGGSTQVTSTITNTGTGSADTLDYTGLTTTGTVSGGSLPQSGGPVANNGGSASGTGTLSVGTTTGFRTIAPIVGTATNANLGTAATLDTTTTGTIDVVANRVVTASSVDLGRVMVNYSINGTSTLSTTGDDADFTRVTVGTAGPDANGISATGGTDPTFNSASVTDTRTLSGTFSTAGNTSGTFTLVTTGEGLAGEAPINVALAYTADAVNKRVITDGATTDLGTLHNGATVSTTSNAFTTTGTHDTTTDVSVAAADSVVDANGISLSGSATTFDGTISSDTRNLSGTIVNAIGGTTSGTFGLAVTTLENGGAGLTGEGSYNNVNVAYTAFVYTGQGVWNTNGGGSWGAVSATPTNWTADGGTPGLDANFTTTDSATFGGALTSGSGTVTLDGDNPSLNAITFNDSNGTYNLAQGTSGTITLNNGGNRATISDLAGLQIISAPIALASSAEVTVSADQELILSGNISGNHGLIFFGPGTTLLSGTNSYTGTTVINAGTMAVGNSAAFGNGNVVNFGTLTTANDNHLITVNGNYTQGANATLLLNIYSTTNDMLQLTGNGVAFLNGTLSLNLVGGFDPGSGQKFTLISSNETVSGTFSSVITNLPSIGLVTDYTNDVTVLYQKSFVDLLGGSLTPNQRAGATYIDAHDLHITNPAFGDFVAALNSVSGNPQSLSSAFNEFTAPNFASFASSNAFNNASFSIQQFDNYLANHRGADGTFVSSAGGIDYSGLAINDPNIDAGLQSVRSRLLAWSPAPSLGLLSDTGDPVLGGIDLKDSNAALTGPTNLWNVFVTGNVVLAQDFSNPSAGIPYASSTTGAAQIGADYKVTPHLLLGVTFGYGHTNATLDSIGSNASVNTYSPGVYLSYANSGWYYNALGSYGFSGYSQDRNVSIGAFNGSAHSSPGGNQIVGDLDGGYDFHRGNWTFGPTLGAQYVHLNVDGYTETGLPGADLTVDQDSSDSFRSLLGGRVSYAVKSGDMIFTPHLSASWQHEFLDQSRGITSQFSDVGAGSFVVDTPNPSRESALVDVGFDAQVNNALTVFTDYSVQAGQSNYFGQSIQAGVKIGF